jgi:hypothetical protein
VRGLTLLRAALMFRAFGAPLAVRVAPTDIEGVGGPEIRL